MDAEITLTKDEVKRLVAAIESLSRHVRMGNGYIVIEDAGAYDLFRRLKKYLATQESAPVAS